MGYKLSTYATWWIRAGSAAGARRAEPDDPAAVHIADQCGGSSAPGVRWAAANRDPSIDEIAVVTELAPLRVQELLDLVQEHVSLETPVGDGESVMSDLIEDTWRSSPKPRRR